MKKVQCEIYKPIHILHFFCVFWASFGHANVGITGGMSELMSIPYFLDLEWIHNLSIARASGVLMWVK
jgi:hypothetical protein